jgi:hypothetical protein
MGASKGLICVSIGLMVVSVINIAIGCGLIYVPTNISILFAIIGAVFISVEICLSIISVMMIKLIGK